VEGSYRFLKRVWRLVAPLAGKLKTRPWPDTGGLVGVDREMHRLTHVTIKRVTEDVGNRFNFNTAVSAIMEMVNGLYQYREVPETDRSPAVLNEAVEAMLLLLAPFAPHITEELWHGIGRNSSIHLQHWPVYSTSAVAEDEVTIVVQLNGRIKEKMLVPSGLSGDGMKELVMAKPTVLQMIEGRSVVKVIAVPGKLVNIVVK